MEITNLKDIENFLLKSKFKNVLIIGGSISYNACGFKKIIMNKKYNFKINYFFKKKKIPEFNELIEIIDLIENLSPDLIIAVGGGSVLDYSKIASSIVKSKDLQNQIQEGSYKLKKRNLKLLNIPTTAGSGAEVTSTAVIYTNNKKYSVEGLEIRPDYFFLVPELLKSNNFITTSASGLDCIAQALESLFALRSTDKSVEYALKSLEISLPNFGHYLKKPNTDNSAKMLIASNLSGEAINISRTIAPHALSYPFTSLYGLPHGQAVFITLKEIMKFNSDYRKNANVNFNFNLRLEKLLKITKSNNEKFFFEYLDNLKKLSNLDFNLKNFGIDIQNDYRKILDGVNLKRLGNNPVKIDEKAIKKILMKV